MGRGGVGEEVEEAVRPRSHVADPPVAAFEQPLLVHHPIAVEDEAGEEPETERAHEQVAAPAGGTGRPRRR